MSERGVRYMWLLVFFDIPVDTRAARKSAARFRKFLLNDGYVMLQYSVYACPCKELDGVKTHIARLRSSLPKKGNIRSMRVTDQQYGRIELHLGTKSSNEELGAEKQLCLF